MAATPETVALSHFEGKRVSSSDLAPHGLLIAGIAGAAFARLDHVVRLQATPLASGNLYGANSVTRAGWTVGGGSEWWMNGNWSLRAEYLYFDLGKTSVTLTDPAQFPGVYLNYDVETTGQVARVAVNYRFSHPEVVPLNWRVLPP